MKGMSDSAPRADRVTRGRIRAVSRLDLSVHMSFWLCGSCPPSGFREGTTTLIPKRAEATQPSEYRPITNATIIARLFHRLMARRLEDSIPLSPRQKAFWRGDGLADNVWLLRSILNDRTRSRKPVFVTFIDVAKAFDSVSHQTLIIAARRVGVPDIVLEYIASLYTGTTTRIKVGKLLSDKIHVQRGVRQGAKGPSYQKHDELQVK